MNIETAKQLQSDLEKNVSEMVHDFEKASGLTVLNLYIYETKSGSEGHVIANTQLRQNEKAVVAVRPAYNPDAVVSEMELMGNPK